MVWNWPQIMWVVCVAIGVLVAAVNDGEPKTGKHSFAVTVCAVVMTVFILWQGGFWAGASP